MKAFSKKLALLMFALVATLCIGLAACKSTPNDPNGGDDDKDKNITYTVTVECEEAMILGGVNVQLKDAGGAVAGESALTNGVATFSLPAATYSVYLAEKAGFEGFLENYVYTIANVTPAAPNATVTLAPPTGGNDTEDKVSYTLTVKLPDGTPVSGIIVQLCGGPVYMCNPKQTDENGVAVMNLIAGEYEVHIAESFWPEGYTFDDTEFTMGEEGGSLTVYFHEA